MRRRFNKSAAAVRARMAQKCKDERRFGRVLPSGAIATNSDRSHPNSSAASAVNSASGISAASTTPAISRPCAMNRRRSAGYATGNGPTAKNPRLSLTSQTVTLPNPSQPAPTSSMLTSLPSENYASSSSSSVTAAAVAASSTMVNSTPSTVAVGIHDPPVILASAPEMAS